jgi:hypothetical protein
MLAGKKRPVICTLGLVAKKRHFPLAISVLLGFYLLQSLPAQAQILYATSWRSEATIRVFVTTWRSEADLLVFRTSWKSEAGGNNGLWFMTSWRSEARHTVFFTTWRSEADLVIFYTPSRSKAGWQNPKKGWMLQ